MPFIDERLKISDEGLNDYFVESFSTFTHWVLNNFYILLSSKIMKMRKFTFCSAVAALLFVSQSSMAQLYVSNNSYVFNKGAYVYVKGDVELNAANSNFYLRNEGQLLQGGTGSGGVNKGNGNLSVFQEGTSNNYAYNYWCSPVGVPQGATVGNAVFGIHQVKRPSGLITFNGESYTPTVDGSATNTALIISSRWIFKCIIGNVYASWIAVNENNTINPGEGFTMKGVSGSDNTDVGESTLNNPGNNQRYDFRGVPNEGTIDIQVASVAGPDYPNLTLTGNPYPSAINLNLFLLENSGYTVNYTTGAYAAGGPTNVITGIAYFWEQRKTPAPSSHVLSNYVGGYGQYVANGVTAFSPGTYNNATWNTYNPDGTPNTTGGAAGTNRYKRMFTPVAQGFMVNGSTTGTAKMKNLYRTFVKEGVANNSEFERVSNNHPTTASGNWDEIPNVANVDYTQFSKAEVPQIKIHTSLNDQFTREITLAFNPNTTDGYDTAMDAVSNEGNLPTDVYFPLNNTSQFVISTLPFAIDKRVPIGFKNAETAQFKVKVGEIINFDGAQNIYLHDKASDMYYDIKNSTYEMTLPAGVNNTQYEVTFMNDNALAVASLSSDTFDVVQNNDQQNLYVANPKGKELKTVSLYDMGGKLIFSKNKLGSKSNYQFSTAGISDAVYIVKITTTDNQEVGKKITVRNSK
jgi:hypothetical protein